MAFRLHLRKIFDRSFWIFAVLTTASGIACYVVRGPEDFFESFSRDLELLGLVGPRLGAALLIAASIQVLLPRDKVARWLGEQPQVGLVLHPALPGCPGHDIWARDFKGSSGLFSFELKAGDRAAFVESLELFGIGYSWGGYESLAIPVDPQRTVSRPPAPNLVRLHVGLEDPDDLIADLAAALGRL